MRLYKINNIIVALVGIMSVFLCINILVNMPNLKAEVNFEEQERKKICIDLERKEIEKYGVEYVKSQDVFLCPGGWFETITASEKYNFTNKILVLYGAVAILSTFYLVNEYKTKNRIVRVILAILIYIFVTLILIRFNDLYYKPSIYHIIGFPNVGSL